MATKPGSDDDRPVLDDDIRQIVSDARPWEKKEPDDDQDVLREHEGPERVFVDVNVPQRIEAGGPQHNGEYTISGDGKPPADEEHGGHRERPEEEPREYEPFEAYEEPAAEAPPDTDDSEVATGDGAVAPNDGEPDVSVGDGGGVVDDTTDDSTDEDPAADSSNADDSGAERNDDSDDAAFKSDGGEEGPTAFGSGSTPDARQPTASGDASGDFGSGVSSETAPVRTPEDDAFAIDDVKEPEAAHDDGAFDEIDEPKPADDGGDFQLDEKDLDLDEVEDIDFID